MFEVLQYSLLASLCVLMIIAARGDILSFTISNKLNTVIALGVGTRCDENGEDHVVAPILERLGYKLERAKTNIGLGRINRQLASPATSAKETVNA